MSQRPAGKPLGFWLLLIGLIAALCVGGLVLLSAHRQPGAQVRITQNGQQVGLYPLDQPRTLRLDAPGGGYNVVVIEDGAVQVTEASCPDQICVKKGPTSQTADPIACLPNGLILEVLAPDGDDQLDGVTQ